MYIQREWLYSFNSKPKTTTMKRVLKILGVILGIILIALIGFAAFLKFKSLPNYDTEFPAPDLEVALTPERIELGRKLIDHNCAGCHQGNGRQLDGILFEDEAALKAFGTFYTPNITNHPEYGVGRYSDGELYRLLRTGIKKTGENMLPVMPRFVIASDEDIYAMIAYLRSGEPLVAASDQQHPTWKPSLLAKALLSFAIKPYPMKETYPETPLASDSLAMGAYLVNARFGCYFCHSASLESWDLEDPPKTPGYLGGGTEFAMPDYTVVAPSLLMDGLSDVSKWSVDEFIAALKYGQREEKPAYLKPMHPYPLLDSTEVKAIYYYLQDHSAKLMASDTE
jgi:mono/diheme cytochrome c family protein